MGRGDSREGGGGGAAPRGAALRRARAGQEAEARLPRAVLAAAAARCLAGARLRARLPRFPMTPRAAPGLAQRCPPPHPRPPWPARPPY
jgi:hypothetical protein